MKDRTKRFILFILVVESVVLVAVYFFGDYGLPIIVNFSHENKELEQENSRLSDEIAQLNLDLDALANYPFYKEKIAREQLQMAALHDELYLIDSKEL